ncbi:MAG TPA: hypothetical protein DCP92_14860 [Nitrospiraceae bacterium]|jgi:hypothetical protein|nr:hypothetical protein [Nitrospiraceae bacterium]
MTGEIPNKKAKRRAIQKGHHWIAEKSENNKTGVLLHSVDNLSNIVDGDPHGSGIDAAINGVKTTEFFICMPAGGSVDLIFTTLLVKRGQRW